MKKRNKHILINLNEDQYNALVFIAEKQRRKMADAAYIIISDALNSAVLKEIVIYDGNMEQLQFKNDDSKE